MAYMIDKLKARPFRATDYPESDGTLPWDSTAIETQAGNQTRYSFRDVGSRNLCKDV